MDTTAATSFRTDNPTTTSQACHGPATVHNPVRGRLNAAVLRTSDAYGHLLLGRRKRRLFAGLPPTVVEVGPGTGANLRYYRPGSRLVAIEPNPHMHAPLRKAARRHGIELELRAEGADAIGLPDASVDAVVSTLVLCTVPDPAAYHVRYLRYWVDEQGGRVFCLVEAPSAKAAADVHREAHGLVADHIYQVEEGS